MKKEIVVLLSGNAKSVVKQWLPIANYETKSTSERRCSITFPEDKFDEILELKKFISEKKFDVKVFESFVASDFSPADLKPYPLLQLFGRCFVTLNLLEQWKGTNKALEDGIIRFHYGYDFSSEGSLEDQLIACSSGGQILFHESLVDQLITGELTSGLTIIPTEIEVESESYKLDKWHFVSSTIDVGQPMLPTRFVPQYAGALPATHFYSSSWSNFEDLFVSQAVYQVIMSIPPEQRQNISFEPIQVTR